MVKATELITLLSGFSVLVNGARFDSENNARYEHTARAGDLLKYATQSNKYGNQRTAGSASGASRATASVSAAATTESSLTIGSSSVTPLSPTFLQCPDSKLLAGGCPTDASSKDATCATNSVLVPGISKRVFCPTACDTCEWNIRPKAAVDMQTPYCLTATQGGMLPCVNFDEDIDFKLLPRESNGKVFWNVISSNSNFCLQDLSDSMVANNTLIAELSATAAAEEETDQQSLTDQALQDAAENPLEFFGPCIQGKFEERQQWQLIQTGQPERHLLRNRRTNKCLHFSPKEGAKVGDAPFTRFGVSECVDRMFTEAKHFYNQAIVLTTKPKSYVLQQSSGAMRCVAAPLIGTSNPSASLAATDCLLTPEQGRHVFEVVPFGPCYTSKGDSYCPHILRLSSASSAKHCLVATKQSNGKFYPTMASCGPLTATPRANQVVATFAQVQTTLNQVWQLRRSQDSSVQRFELRWLDEATGKELCLTYAAASQGAAGELQECTATNDPKEWTVRPYVSGESLIA